MLEGSKQPWMAASGLLLYADDSNNYKHNHTNEIFKQSLWTEIQLAIEMPIRKVLHASFLALVHHVHGELIKACLNWARYAFVIFVGDESCEVFGSGKNCNMAPYWPIGIPNLWERIMKIKTAEIYCFL